MLNVIIIIIIFMLIWSISIYSPSTSYSSLGKRRAQSGGTGFLLSTIPIVNISMASPNKTLFELIPFYAKRILFNILARTSSSILSL